MPKSMKKWSDEGFGYKEMDKLDATLSLFSCDGILKLETGALSCALISPPEKLALWIFTYKLPANKSAACVEFNRIILENVPLSAPKVKPRGVKSIKNILNQLRAQLKGGFLTICEVLLLPPFINKKA
jgi:hypothetical protein